MALFQKYFAALFLAALLQDYSSIIDHLRKIPNTRVIEIGRTGLNQPMYAALIGKAGPGAKYTWEQFTPEEADKVLERATLLAASKSRDAVTILIPSTNPDGLDLLAKWRRQNLGSPYEAAPYPGLPQKYSDEPDDVMQNRVESRNLANLRRAYGIAPSNATGQYIVPKTQHDPPTAFDLLQRFAANGAKVFRQRDTGDFLVQGGSKLVEMHLPELMGVEIRLFDGKFEGDPLTDFRPEGQSGGQGETVLLNPAENNAYLGMSFLFDRTEPVWWTRDGKVIIDSGFTNSPVRALNFAHEIGITTTLAPSESVKPAWQIYRPRIAVYEPWLNNPDTGWTEWLLDVHKVPYDPIHNEDFLKDDLDERFQTIVLSSQPAASIMHGERTAVQRPEYAGGITLDGAAHLEHFVKKGGTLVVLGAAVTLPVEQFGLPVKLLPIQGGSAALSADRRNRIAFGMPSSFTAVTLDGYAMEGARSVAKFADGKSGVTEVDWGQGRIVLFGIRPQYRGQTFATFKLMLNAIFTGAARELR